MFIEYIFWISNSIGLFPFPFIVFWKLICLFIATEKNVINTFDVIVVGVDTVFAFKFVA